MYSHGLQYIHPPLPLLLLLLLFVHHYLSVEAGDVPYMYVGKGSTCTHAVIEVLTSEGEDQGQNSWCRGRDQIPEAFCDTSKLSGTKGWARDEAVMMSKTWEVDAETRAKLLAISASKENNKCVDCGAPSPQWVGPLIPSPDLSSTDVSPPPRRPRPNSPSSSASPAPASTVAWACTSPSCVA